MRLLDLARSEQHRGDPGFYVQSGIGAIGLAAWCCIRTIVAHRIGQCRDDWFVDICLSRFELNLEPFEHWWMLSQIGIFVCPFGDPTEEILLYLIHRLTGSHPDANARLEVRWNRRSPRPGVHSPDVDRPGSLNALDTEMLSDLIDVIAQADGERSVLIVDGAGDAFCSGADINEPDPKADLLQELTRSTLLFDGLVLGALHGWVIGGGFEWTLSFDLRYGEPDTTFKLPESEIGFTITNGSTLLLPLTVGMGHAKELVYTGRAVSADEATRLGLLTDVVPADDLHDHVESVAASLVNDHSSAALRLNKRGLNAAFPISETLERERLISEYNRTTQQMDE